ncbi:MAG: type II toxin-antitoxin system PemK/MazF family toxin [Bradymonadales bacterium]|nr:MAG: type II toxin-antitoxin system PemK/MazF family toxin [Bradymonadales bacterium]
MRRGAICWIQLGKGSPPEFGKTRPGLIVSNTQQNEILDSVVVIPLSSQPPEIWPLRVKINLPKKKPSFVVIPGMRQVSKGRLGEIIGFLSANAMSGIDEALLTYLND